MTDTNITAETILKYTVTITMPAPDDNDSEDIMESEMEISYTALKAELRADFDLPNNTPVEYRPGKHGKPGTATASMYGPGIRVSIRASY